MKQVAFILHGKIKHRDKFIAKINACFADSADVSFLITEHADHSIALAYKAAMSGATHVICVGGDGSLNEVVNGVMQAAQQGKDVKVGLLPHGTGNDFARTMQVTNNIQLLKKWIDEDSFRVIDIGRAEYHDRNKLPSSRFFVNITDVGIGGAIAHNLANSSRFLGATLTYQKAILSSLISYKNQPVKVHADTFDYESSVMSLIVANGRFFGGGMGIAPDALPDDKLFSVVIIGKISTFEYLKNLGAIKKSQKIDHPDLKYLSATEIQIESPAGPLPIDMDGEFIGFSPIKMKVVPGAIKFIAPK